MDLQLLSHWQPDWGILLFANRLEWSQTRHWWASRAVLWLSRFDRLQRVHEQTTHATHLHLHLRCLSGGNQLMIFTIGNFHHQRSHWWEHSPRRWPHSCLLPRLRQELVLLQFEVYLEAATDDCSKRHEWPRVLARARRHVGQLDWLVWHGQQLTRQLPPLLPRHAKYCTWVLYD